MSENTKLILTLFVILMYAVGVILFFINLFDNSFGDDQALRTKIFCGLMVGATILGGIVKVAGNNNDDK